MAMHRDDLMARIERAGFPVSAEVADRSAEAMQARAHLVPRVDRVLWAAPEEDEPVRNTASTPSPGRATRPPTRR